MTELRYGGANPVEIMAWQRAILAFAPSYARKLNGQPLAIDGWIGDDDAIVAAAYRARRKLPAPPKGVVVTHEEYSALVKPPPGVIVVPRKRHLGIVFRGTGGIIGQDYVSRVCQGAGDLIEERNPEWPASMGGLPPGAPGTPSMNKGVEIALRSGAAEIRSGRTFVLGGYSAGAIVASKLRAMLEPGQPLAEYRQNYVCGFTLGNPSRAFGHTYFMGSIPNGQGISDWHMPAATLGWDWADLAHPDDMYANVPLGDTYDIMSAFYRYITDLAMDDPIKMMTAALPLLLTVLDEAGITLPLITGALGSLTNPVALIGLMLPMLISMLPGLIGANGGQLTGPAAAAQAAIIALKFLASGTAAHINYHAWEVWPGQTYLGLAVQHVRDWAGRTPVRG